MKQTCTPLIFILVLICEQYLSVLHWISLPGKQGFHHKCRFSHQKVVIVMSMWFLIDESWVTRLLHLIDVRVYAKRFEWLGTKYFPCKEKKSSMGSILRKIEKKNEKVHMNEILYEWLFDSIFLLSYLLLKLQNPPTPPYKHNLTTKYK